MFEFVALCLCFLFTFFLFNLTSFLPASVFYNLSESQLICFGSHCFFFTVHPTLLSPIHFSVCLSVCLSVSLSLSVCLSIYLSVCLSVCLYVSPLSLSLPLSLPPPPPAPLGFISFSVSLHTAFRLYTSFFSLVPSFTLHTFCFQI